jgi:Skp family chaperone for outer membrane proteins
VQDLQQQLQQEFQQKLEPVIQSVATEMGLHFVFNGPDAGLVWADQALDISADVIKKLDLASGKPAPKPAPTKPPGQ